MPRVWPLVLIALLVPPWGVAEAGPKALRGPTEIELPFKARPTDMPAFSHYGPRATLEAGMEHIRGHDLRVGTSGGKVELRWQLGDKSMRQRLSRRKGHRIRLAANPDRHLVCSPDHLGVWHHAGGDALRFRCQGVDFEVVDQDLDGRWFEVGDDMIRRVGDAHLLPLREVHAVEDWSLRVVAHDMDRRRVRLLLAPLDLDANEEEREVLRTLNRERTRMGLLGVEILPDHARRLRLHAEWMALHAKMQHEETPGTKGYTPEGNEAGMSSVLLTHIQHAAIATYVDLDAPIHGHVLGMPEFIHTGIGAVRGRDKQIYGGIWTMERGGYEYPRLAEARFPAVWPPHMATDVPRSWTAEGEDPRPPDDRGREQGYPIRVYLSPGIKETADLRDLVVDLRICGRKGEALECNIIAPDRPLGHESTPYLDFLLTALRPIFILPRRVLDPDTWYCLTLDYKLGDVAHTHRTVFRTGKQRGQYRDMAVGASR